MQLTSTNIPKILILCNGKFAIPSIQVLSIENYVCGIGIGDAKIPFSFQMEDKCEQSRIAFKQFPTLKSLSEMREWLDEICPDFIFSICFPYRLTREILDFKKYGFINFHTGPLPKYRGAMPIFEVLRRQEKTTALTVHYMDEEFDSGSIILEECIPIAEGETFGSLSLKQADTCGFVAMNIAQMLHYASHIPSKVQEERHARYFEYPSHEDTQIKWEQMPVDEIEALVRACNPWNNGVEAVVEGHLIWVISACISEKTHNTIPGRILGLDEHKRLLVSCLNQKCLAVKIIKTTIGYWIAEDYYSFINKNSFEHSFQKFINN